MLKLTPDKINNELHKPGHQKQLQEVLIPSASYRLPSFLILAYNSSDLLHYHGPASEAIVDPYGNQKSENCNTRMKSAVAHFLK
jgi:hypothetical protein